MRPLLLVVTMALGACASAPKASRLNPPPQTPKGPKTSAILGLVGLHGGLAVWGHACPVDDQGIKTIYSARHLLLTTTSEGKEILHNFTWEDYEGHKGKAQVQEVSNYRDLGTLTLTGDSPRYYPLARTRPKPGDPVWWREFNNDIHKTLTTEERRSKVLRVRLGHIVIRGLPAFGASGSCLLNSRGEVVGIVVWGRAKGEKNIGGAVLLVE